MSETPKEEKPIKQPFDYNEYHKNYMRKYREKNKLVIERKRITNDCLKNKKLPSARALKLHNFTQEELDIFFKNLTV